MSVQGEIGRKPHSTWPSQGIRRTYSWLLSTWVYNCRLKNPDSKTNSSPISQALRTAALRGLCVIVILSLTSACATSPRKRMIIGSGTGAAMGAASGALLSPNSESRGINTLVFGLMGALAGGLGTLLFSTPDEVPPAASGTTSLLDESNYDERFITHPSQELPPFVRERLMPVVVETLTEPDTVSEDGSLHEPHKVYRIKRQAELVTRPKNSAQKPKQQETLR